MVIIRRGYFKLYSVISLTLIEWEQDFYYYPGLLLDL